jgi:hypothetical protein
MDMRPRSLLARSTHPPLSIVRGDYNVTTRIDDGVDQLLNFGLITGDFRFSVNTI